MAYVLRREALASLKPEAVGSPVAYVPRREEALRGGRMMGRKEREKPGGRKRKHKGGKDWAGGRKDGRKKRGAIKFSVKRLAHGPGDQCPGPGPRAPFS